MLLSSAQLCMSYISPPAEKYNGGSRLPPSRRTAKPEEHRSSGLIYMQFSYYFHACRVSCIIVIQSTALTAVPQFALFLLLSVSVSVMSASSTQRL